jgi:hypothetical protein
MPRTKNDAVKLKICILHKQQSSINFSIRLEKNITKEDAIKKSIEFLKQNL